MSTTSWIGFWLSHFSIWILACPVYWTIRTTWNKAARRVTSRMHSKFLGQYLFVATINIYLFAHTTAAAFIISPLSSNRSFWIGVVTILFVKSFCRSTHVLENILLSWFLSIRQGACGMKNTISLHAYATSAKRSFPCAELRKSCAQNRASQTGYETWNCELGNKIFVNLDVEVNEKRVPSNQKTRLNHESISSSTWKLGLLFCLDTH